MWSQERHRRILALLDAQKQVSANDLAGTLGVSRETVRRDLLDLELEGRLNRIHGGAVLPGSASEPPFERRKVTNISAKRTIARKAIGAIEPGQTIFMDAGTTTSIFAKELVKRDGVSLITNSLEAASTLHSLCAEFEVILLGGQILTDVPATLGDFTLTELRRFKADVAVLSPFGLHPMEGAFSFDLHEAAIARAMSLQAERTIILADRSKLGLTGRISYCPTAQIDTIVTELQPDDSLLSRFAEYGVAQVL